MELDSLSICFPSPQSMELLGLQLPYHSICIKWMVVDPMWKVQLGITRGNP
ncbi:hypothetical protein Sjap_023829 [Stephania japonica]|uniref:Uncharacterized protein n=1 Tax=Stephania japonica TaxID=461633 RepID=A0AAP0EFH9_9MAGN